MTPYSRLQRIWVRCSVLAVSSGARVPRVARKPAGVARVAALVVLLSPVARVVAGPFAPGAGQAGSTARSWNDAGFKGWATGWTNYIVGSNCDTNWQTPQKALGPATNSSFDIVCLGRGGRITLTFAPPIRDGTGPDFAVFENGISDGFLELGFVEVSSDGQNFFRFPNESLTPSPVGGFGTLDPTNLDGYASKYRQGYGTPFDLAVLAGASPELDRNRVAYVRVIDIVGDGSATDTVGRIIYDPYPTVGSAGVDLDGVGVLNPAVAAVGGPAEDVCWQQFRSGAAHTGNWGGTLDSVAVAPLWTAAGHGLLRATQPAVSRDGTLVFAYGERAHPQGALLAFRAYDGRVAWSNAVRAHVEFASWSSPVYHDGYVYWAGGPAPAEVRRVRALDGSTNAADGAWCVALNGAVVNASPTIAGDRLVVSTYGGFDPTESRQYALRLADGRVAWERHDGGYGSGAMAFDTARGRLYQTIYTNGQHRLCAYEAADGTVAWVAAWTFESAEIPSPFQCGIACQGDRIALLAYDFGGDGALVVADAANGGALLWRAATPGAGDASPAFDPQGNLYTFGGHQERGSTRGFDAAGNPLWTFDQGGGWQGSPAWAGGLVMAGDQLDSNLHLLRAADGIPTLRVAGSGPVAFGRNAFYSIGVDGTLHAYRANGLVDTNRQAFALTFEDLEVWTGTGSNEAALVIDWHDGREPHALAWGFRWDGTASALDLWNAVTNADAGLRGTLTNCSGQVWLTGIEYRRPAREGDALPGGAQPTGIPTAYSLDHTGTVFAAGAWSHWTADDLPGYALPAFTHSSTGLAARPLRHHAWDAWCHQPDPDPTPPGFLAAALRYPFAASVVDYHPGSGLIDPDWISGDLFTNAVAALGRPTVDTSGEGDHMPESARVPIVPPYPAFRAYEVVSVGNGGQLTLAFDHPVCDHPANPHGADLLVFGNSFQTGSGGNGWTNGDPSTVTLGASARIDGGRVRVSQDGVCWHDLTNAVADGFFPTLGRVYAPGGADTNLGPANLWWGAPTDPTVPPDGRVAPSAWNGRTVADISARYRGGAGGTPFDLAALPLDPDPATGRKWIRYVRVVRDGANNPEVDAVADVSPVWPHEHWRLDHFGWMANPALEADDADPDADGIPNLLAYALGRDPTNGAPDEAFETTIAFTNGRPALRLDYAVATGAVDVITDVERTADLVAGLWSTAMVVQVAGPATNGSVRLTATSPVDAPTGYLRLRARHRP